MNNGGGVIVGNDGVALKQKLADHAAAEVAGLLLTMPLVLFLVISFVVPIARCFSVDA